MSEDDKKGQGEEILNRIVMLSSAKHLAEPWPG
jgi:hypothetical protein